MAIGYDTKAEMNIQKVPVSNVHNTLMTCMPLIYSTAVSFRDLVLSMVAW